MSSETDDAADGATASSNDTYVHDPSAFDDSGERVDESDERADPVTPAATDREFDWRGWALVGVVFFSFIVAPIVVYLRPPQLPYFVTLIVFPLLPAIVLGATAVWATTRP